MREKLTIIFFIALLFSPLLRADGVTSSLSSSLAVPMSKSPGVKTIGSAKFLEIAEREYRRRVKPKGKLKPEILKTKSGITLVAVWELPATPGLFAIVYIDSVGNVVDFQAGR